MILFLLCLYQMVPLRGGVNEAYGQCAQAVSQHFGINTGMMLHQQFHDTRIPTRRNHHVCCENPEKAVEKTVNIIGDGLYGRSDKDKDTDEDIIKTLCHDIQQMQQKPHVMYMGFSTQAHAIDLIWPGTEWSALPMFMIHALNKTFGSCKLWVVDYEWRRVGTTGADCWCAIMQDRCLAILKKSLLELVGCSTDIFTLCKFFWDIEQYRDDVVQDFVPAITAGSVLVLGDFCAMRVLGELYNSIFMRVYREKNNTIVPRMIYFQLPGLDARGIAVWYNTPFNDYDSKLFRARMIIVDHMSKDSAWLRSMNKKSFIHFIKKIFKDSSEEMYNKNDKELLHDLFYRKLSCQYAPCDYPFHIVNNDRGQFYLENDMFQELDLLHIPEQLRDAYAITDDEAALLRDLCMECDKESQAAEMSLK